MLELDSHNQVSWYILCYHDGRPPVFSSSVVWYSFEELTPETMNEADSTSNSLLMKVHV